MADRIIIDVKLILMTKAGKKNLAKFFKEVMDGEAELEHDLALNHTPVIGEIIEKNDNFYRVLHILSSEDDLYAIVEDV